MELRFFWGTPTLILLSQAALADTQEVTPVGDVSDIRYFDAKVGIGTTTPASLLDIATSSGNPITLSGTGSGTYTRTALYADTSNDVLLELPRITDSAGGTPRDFLIDARGGGANFFHIDGGTGNIGVGTTASASIKFKVNGSTETGFLTARTTFAYGHAARFYQDSDAGDGIAIQVEPNDQSSGSYYYLTAYDGGGFAEGALIVQDGTFKLVQLSDPTMKTDIAHTTVDGLSVVGAIELIQYRFIGSDGVDPIWWTQT